MKYLKITRSDVNGTYIQDRVNLLGCVEGEFEDLQNMDAGTSVTFTVVDMTDEEYLQLPEFLGW